MKIALIILLTLITLFKVGNVIFSRWSVYSAKNYWQRFPALKQSYIDSQYVNKHPKGWIPDEAVNSYAGGAYVKGILPQLIAPDTPPLGRYVIGLSAIIFGNENVLVGSITTLSLIFLFLLGNQVFKNSLISLIPVVLVSSERIFLNQFVYTPLLDGMQLCFLLATFFFFNKANYFLMALFLGLFISTKFYITGITIIFAVFFVLIIHKNIKDFLLALISSAISILILLMTYIRSFWFGYNVKSFLGIQKYILLYHKSQLILPFSIWPLLLLNKWHVWFGNKAVISDSQWQITWPIITIISAITILFYIFKKIQKNIHVEILMAWSVLYILFFSFGQISSRYLVIYIPVLYIISVYGLMELALGFRKKT